MESVICLHSDLISSATHIGKCKICGQQKRYDPEHPGKFTLIKRGSIDGKPTEVIPPKQGQRVPESSPTYFKPYSKPPNWDQLKLKEKSAFYDENRGYILKTVEELGVNKALEKLGIPIGSWNRLRKRWGLKPQERKKKKPRKITGRAELVEAKRVTKEPAPEPESAPFHTGPLNKRHGVRAIWRF